MTNARKKTEGKNGGWFSRISVAEWIAIMGVLTIVTSFVWEWGYWGAFGVSLAVIPMSIENLANAVLAWMPWFLGAVPTMVALVYSCFTYGAAASNMRDETPQNTISIWKFKINVPPFIWMRINKFPLYLHFNAFIIVFSTLGIIYLVADWTYFPEKIPAVAVWGAVCIAFFVILSYTSVPKSIVALFSAFLILGFLYVSSQETATRDAARDSAHAEFHIMENGEIRAKKAIVLRSDSDFLFVYDSTYKKLTVLPWKNVLSISYESEPTGSTINNPFFSHTDRQNEISPRPLPRAPTPRH